MSPDSWQQRAGYATELARNAVEQARQWRSGANRAHFSVKSNIGAQSTRSIKKAMRYRNEIGAAGIRLAGGSDHTLRRSRRAQAHAAPGWNMPDVPRVRLSSEFAPTRLICRLPAAGQWRGRWTAWNQCSFVEPDDFTLPILRPLFAGRPLRDWAANTNKLLDEFGGGVSGCADVRHDLLAER